jgi:predicted phage baseplate assembly protein
MSQMSPNLDDLRFQKDLVDEARRRIIRYCPEWTDYNLSDPGITLVELFAFMTEMLVYRLNRVPEKNYLKFLEMVGMHPHSASSARAEMTFFLSVPFPLNPGDDLQATVPQGLEVTTRPSEEEQEITFTIDERMVISGPSLVQLRKDTDFNKNYLPRLGIEPFYAFSASRPQNGDTFYVGFDETKDIRGYIVRLTFDCDESLAVGVRRDDPPWVWECSLGENQWKEIPVSTRKGEKDTTGGLNNPHGSLILHLPLEINLDQVHGRNAYWLRCRLDSRSPEQGMYTESPRIRALEAHALGGKTWATHATIVREEVVGMSTGEPSQVFKLQHAPVLVLRAEETVEVEERTGAEIVFRPWTRVENFARSDRFDRHFVLDEATGEVQFGPAVRQSDGTIQQYGRVPEAGRRVRLNQYRYGGGVSGNVPAEKIELLRSAVPYVDRVINFTRAEGGRDQENLEEVKIRAQRELRAQERAVTAEDFENLTIKASRQVARVKCYGAGRMGHNKEAQAPGTIELLMVPAAFDAIQAGDLTKLIINAALKSRVREVLDKHRLLATILNIREPQYCLVKVHAEIVVSEFSQPEIVKNRVNARLKRYLAPLKFGLDKGQEEYLDPNWEGWPFGRDLFVVELYSFIQQVPGVKHVLDVRLSSKNLLLGQGGPEDADDKDTGWVPLTQRMLPVADNMLLCSYDHEVEVVEI